MWQHVMVLWHCTTCHIHFSRHTNGTVSPTLFPKNRMDCRRVMDVVDGRIYFYVQISIYHGRVYHDLGCKVDVVSPQTYYMVAISFYQERRVSWARPDKRIRNLARTRVIWHAEYIMSPPKNIMNTNPVSNMQQLVSHWNAIMQPKTSSRKRRRDEDTQPTRPKTLNAGYTTSTNYREHGTESTPASDHAVSSWTHKTREGGSVFCL